MSFIVGRLAAGREAAYFLQESKHAVARLAEKTNDPISVATASSRPPTATLHRTLIDNEADILPEILKHNLPSKIFRPPSDSTLSTGSKWLLHSDESNGVSFAYRDAINPLSAYISLPQATFGPRRWQLPNTENPFYASTANDLRRDKYTSSDTNRFKAATLELPQMAKAFATTTTVVFGGASLMIGLAALQLDLHTIDDVQTKGKDIVQPKIESIKEQIIPFKTWAEDVGKKWRIEREEHMKEKPLVKELRRMFGAKRST
ncbi:hypothetical protein L6452_23344 [Arctium lappa]|uniref:Uncharacterized protein n=1 Tax=Arctium lappa TaxID=4217 RepID=A0ACB9B342_ARCLA|nr:hypothetical protein L6452_23344 [Arctium lappa]